VQELAELLDLLGLLLLVAVLKSLAVLDDASDNVRGGQRRRRLNQLEDVELLGKLNDKDIDFTGNY